MYYNSNTNKINYLFTTKTLNFDSKKPTTPKSSDIKRTYHILLINLFDIWGRQTPTVNIIFVGINSCKFQKMPSHIFRFFDNG